MESNNQFSQELPSELSQITAFAPENSTNQELDELELDAIAGGIRTITVSGEKPTFRLTIPTKIFDLFRS
ncbi:hypothetical protein [Microcoleus sp. F4-D5]|uniref:hypothetical protein n=1 Tax=Microcoleus sp. F4-D5 TaxID=2818760 RepID=UPI002FD58DE0